MMVEVPPVSLAQFPATTSSEQAGPHVWFLILNAKEGPFANKLVRQAANYAINKKAIVEDVLEGTQPLRPDNFFGPIMMRSLSLRSGKSGLS